MMTVGEIMDKNNSPDISIFVWASNRVFNTEIYGREFGIEFVGRGYPDKEIIRAMIPTTIIVSRVERTLYISIMVEV